MPTTSAATIRGELPRVSTLTPRKRPLYSPRSFAPAEAMLSRIGPQRWRGETLSYLSSTERSHGSGSVPRPLFSTSSVRPPEVEKK